MLGLTLSSRSHLFPINTLTTASLAHASMFFIQLAMASNDLMSSHHTKRIPICHGSTLGAIGGRELKRISARKSQAT